MNARISVFVLAVVVVACSGKDDDEFQSTSDTGADASDDGGGDASVDGGGDDDADAAGPRCGDGVIDEGEDCDGDAVAESCEGLGQPAGALVCAADCTFDISGCVGGGVCGNGIVDAGEACDGADVAGATCQDLGFDFGVVACDASCALDDSGCADVPVCGDGVREGAEGCDDGNLDHDDGCDVDCVEEVCGDGIVQPGLGEACDTGSVVVATCDDVPGAFGVQFCTGECQLDTLVCPDPVLCGDGVLDLGEACDDGNADDADGCTSACESTTCGDGVLSADEACDGELFALACEDFGFTAGRVQCDACAVSVGACRNAECSDGIVEGPEECDDGNMVSGDGCSRRCEVDACEDGAAQPYWPDGDDDGYGDVNGIPVWSCAAVTGRVDNGDDCDDGDASVSPDAADVCGDFVDNDCNGGIDDGCECTFRLPSPGEGIALHVVTSVEALEVYIGDCANVVDFDDVDTSGGEPVSISANRYVEQGVLLVGEDGQYVDRDFGFPDEFIATSGTNVYAPGPISFDADTHAGGNLTTATFISSGTPGLVAAFGITFIDADYPDYELSRLQVFTPDGGEPFIVEASGDNGEALVRGVVAIGEDGSPVSWISEVEIVNGSGWPANDTVEGVALDDLRVVPPVASPGP